jgi:lysophospholipase L1-like esterase
LRPRRTLVALTIASAATAAALVLAAGTASASTAHYVALGDSYSSGLGAGSYGSSGSCDRSANAYAQLWANSKAPAAFSFVACSGATTGDLLNSQIAAVTGSTTLVSLTIGGNDVGFSSVMETCVLWGTSSCVSAINSAESKAQSILPAAFDNVLRAIKAKAPAAKIVFLDYPDFYDLSQSSGCIGLSGTSRAKVDEGVNVLDSLVQQAAARNGATFADVRGSFAGHEICDGTSWLNSVDWTNFGDSYHPTAAGQSGGYYPVFAANAS